MSNRKPIIDHESEGSTADNHKLSNGLQRVQGEQKTVYERYFTTKIRQCLLHCAIVLGAFVLAFFTLPSKLNAVRLQITPPPEWVGPLAPNYILSYGEKMFQHQIHGPESMVIVGEHVYTASFDGYITDLYHGTMRKIVRFGKGVCGGHHEEHLCGRILGMRMDNDGYLLAIDCYYGLFRVDPETGEYETLYNASIPIEGKLPKLLNDLDIGPDGKIYFTDSHSKFGRNDEAHAVLEMTASGRLLMYDPKTGKTVQLLDKLVFPNGVQLNKNKTAVLISESLRARIIRFDLNTKKVTVWADGLPSAVDNIRYSKDTGTYWTGMNSPRSNVKPNIIDNIALSPLYRQTVLVRLLTEDMAWVIQENFGQLLGYNYGLVAEFDENGKILQTFHDPYAQKVRAASEVHVVNGMMYVGSVKTCLVRLNLTYALS